jgi:hypothetical protein
MPYEAPEPHYSTPPSTAKPEGLQRGIEFVLTAITYRDFLSVIDARADMVAGSAHGDHGQIR